MKPKVAFQSGDLFIVTFGDRDGQSWGRLLNMKSNEPPGPLVPVGSIAAHCPYEDFQKFKGDPKPVLEEIERRLQPR